MIVMEISIGLVYGVVTVIVVIYLRYKMEYCPYREGDNLYDAYEDANMIIQENKFNGKSDPGRVYMYIQQLSTGKTLEECVKQWSIEKEIDVPDGYFCTCGHKIHYMYLMKNSITENMLISGSDCIHKFGDKRLRSEVNRARLKRFLDANMKIPVRMKYVKEVSNDRNTRYMFKLRNGTNLYKVLSEFNTEDIKYCPWSLNKNGDCFLTLIYKYPKEYQKGEWYDIHMSMVEYDISGARVLTFYFRCSS